LAKIDKTIIEAARDMGAKTYQIFWEIILPLSLPGVAIGMVFIFVMIMGEFATAVVVYGGKTSTVGTVILNYYAVANYPFAAVNANRYPKGALKWRAGHHRERKKSGSTLYLEGTTEFSSCSYTAP